jgi:hypothetical protein
MSSDVRDKLAYARKVTAARLSEAYSYWQVEADIIAGPGSLEVRIEDRHECGESHLDIGFVLDRDRADIPVLWDCVSGWGSTGSAALSRAVETWASTTLPVLLEVLTRDGLFADHFHGNDPGGCHGWHVIHGPWIAIGTKEAPNTLQEWAVANPLLPVVGPVAARSFSRPDLNAVKLIFGSGEGEISEVRINGEYDQAGSEYLMSLAWPRSRDVAFARCFFLFMHPE